MVASRGIWSHFSGIEGEAQLLGQLQAEWGEGERSGFSIAGPSLCCLSLWLVHRARVYGQKRKPQVGLGGSMVAIWLCCRAPWHLSHTAASYPWNNRSDTNCLLGFVAMKTKGAQTKPITHAHLFLCPSPQLGGAKSGLSYPELGLMLPRHGDRQHRLSPSSCPEPPGGPWLLLLSTHGARCGASPSPQPPGWLLL